MSPNSLVYSHTYNHYSNYYYVNSYGASAVYVLLDDGERKRHRRQEYFRDEEWYDVRGM